MTDYSVVERTQTIAAPRQEIAPLIVDYHRWIDWSPWEGIDPELRRTYAGPDSGPGAAYEWSGNRKAGAGRMEITSVTDDAVDMDLDFTRPFKSSSKVHFDLVDVENGTRVVWQLKSPKTFMSRLFGLIMNMDKTIGRDLEHGLSKLKHAVERG